jgi:hypothetical protein
MAEKDKPEIQQARLRGLLRLICSGCEIEFWNEGNIFMKFRVLDEKGNPVGIWKGDYTSSMIADKTDEELRGIILDAMRGK